MVKKSLTDLISEYGRNQRDIQKSISLGNGKPTQFQKRNERVILNRIYDIYRIDVEKIIKEGEKK